MRVSALCLSLTLIVGFGTQAPAAPPAELSQINIFIADDRVEVAQNAQSEYSAVGYLEVAVPPTFCGRAPGSKGRQQGEGCLKAGTAFLVSPRHILTSAHLAFAADLQDIGRHQTSMFWVGRHVGAKATPVAWGDYSPAEYRDTQDWALLELDRPLGERFGWLELRAVADRTATREDFKVMSLGFPQDIQRGGQRLMLDPDCRIIKSPLVWKSWSTDCATRRGSSGGPVIHRDGGRLFAVAILAGSRGETEGVVRDWSGVRTNVAVPIAAVLPDILPIIGPGRDPGTASTQTPLPARPAAFSLSTY